MSAISVRPLWVLTSPFSDEAANLHSQGAAKLLRAQGTPAHSAFLPRGSVREVVPGREFDERDVHRGVTVQDRSVGVLYEVVAERRNGAPVCTRLTIAPAASVNMAEAALLKPSFLAVVALAFWDAYDTGAHDPADFWSGHPDAIWQGDAPETERSGKRRPRPAPEQIARAYRDAEAVAGASPRKAIAAAYGVSVPLADKWIASARTAGALPPATRSQGARGGGRPRKQQTATKGTEQ